MKKTVSLLVFLFAFFISYTQYSLRLVVTEIATKKTDEIFTAGNFNDWNPGDLNYKLKPFGKSRRAIVLRNIHAGHYEFKFTRGAWSKVETNAKGESISNHSIELSSDTSFDFTIAGWQDDFPEKPKVNTATAQVQILDTAFFMPQLRRTRRIWIYLPKSYSHTMGKYYPVLYMHDAQNLFNEQTAFSGEWGVDECLDTLQQRTGKECIVVGIDNGGNRRMNEYNPYDNEKYGKGEGGKYVDFLVQTLKPYIDSKFRTIKDAQYTYIAGSSMGALISIYAVVKYPDTFGSAGIFSPSFSISPDLYNDVANAKWNKAPHFYFYAGGKESDTMISDMKKMEDLVSKKNCCISREVIVPAGEHNEKYWRDKFDDFYRWLTGF